MRIGLLAYSSNTGLGYQTLDFARNIECSKILISDLSIHNHMPVHHDRFNKLCNDVRIANGIPTNEEMEWLSDEVDLVFVCETPLNWELFNIARRKGVKTVMQYNYEFLNYFRYPDLPKVDVLASPSYWSIKEVEDFGIAPVKYLPVPINIDSIPLNDTVELETIIHIMGRPAMYDRNGTEIFLKSIIELGTAYNYKIYIQTPKEPASIQVLEDLNSLFSEAQGKLGANLEVIFDIEDNTAMYKEGDLMILPRKYGGLCLPLWEALSAGMPVMMPDISPNNKVLPKEWLISAIRSGTLKTHSEIPMYLSSVSDIVNKVDEIAKNYPEETKKARKLAEDMSWDSQKQNYIDLFESICH